MSQFSFSSLRQNLSHGGDLSVGKRKTARPVVTKRPMHLVLKASSARGSWSMLRREHSRAVKRLLTLHTNRFGVHVYRAANVGNHLHLLVRARSRRDLQGFLRAFSGGVAMAVTGARKGRSLVSRFWDAIVFTRVVEWGKSFEIAWRYVRNQTQGREVLVGTSG